MNRYDEDQMLTLYNQWQVSGENKKDFAIRNHIHPSTFYYWSRKLELAEPISASGFHSVRVEDTPFVDQGELMATIHYPSGARVDLYSPIRNMAGSGSDIIKKLIG